MKFMNLKRFGATVMAGVMAISLAVPAFASSQSTVIDSTFNPITMAVTVPKTGKAIINPYGLPVDLDETTSISGQKLTTGAPLLIENRSKVALQVGGTVTATIKDGSSVTLVDAAPSGTDKKIQAFVQLFEALGVTEANRGDTETVINPMFAALDTANAKDSAKVLTTSGGNAFTTAAGGAGNGLILREASADGELQNGGAGFFRLTGEVVQKPTEEWAKTDGFTVTVAFTFTPDTFAGKTVATNIIASDTALKLTGGTKNGTITPAVMPTGVTATKTVYSSSDPTKLTVNPQTGAYEAKAVTAGTDVHVIATIEGSDGLPYTSNSADITITAT